MNNMRKIKTRIESDFEYVTDQLILCQRTLSEKEDDDSQVMYRVLFYAAERLKKILEEVVN